MVHIQIREWRNSLALRIGQSPHTCSRRKDNAPESEKTAGTDALLKPDA